MTKDELIQEIEDSEANYKYMQKALWVEEMALKDLVHMLQNGEYDDVE